MNIGHANTFKALSDNTRIRILKALLIAKNELCICELMDTLQLANYNISRHMKELKHAGLVKERRDGKFVFYSLTPTSDRFQEQLLKTLQYLEYDAMEDDINRLNKRLSLRKGGKCVIGMKGKCS